MADSDGAARNAQVQAVGWPAEGGLSPLLMEHEMGGSGLMNPPNTRRWHWLPVSPDDNPLQWAHADIWERYPLPGHTSSVMSFAAPLRLPLRLPLLLPLLLVLAPRLTPPPLSAYSG